jgi:hypothetical protein
MIGGVALIAATGATAGPAVVTSIPFTVEFANPCADGELFSATGTVQIVSSINESAGGRSLMHLEMNSSGAQGVTVLPPFKKYVVVDNEGETATADTPFPAEDTLVVTIQFIRQGEDGTLFPGDDLYMDVRVHFTINANGELTADFNRSDARCR